MPDLLPVSMEEMIEEVRREAAMRRRVYSDLVTKGRMNRRLADRRIDIMDALLAYLEQRRGARTVSDVN
jgi:hypothetical protein